MFTIACYCLVVRFGLGSGLGLDLVSGWQVVMHTCLCNFRLSASHCPADVVPGAIARTV